MRKLLVFAAVVGMGISIVAAAQAGLRTQASMMRGIVITNFKVNANKTVTVFVKVHDWTMYPNLVGKKTNTPNGGHWRIYVNGRYNNYSASPKSGHTMKLTHGDYKIYVALANNDRSPVKGAERSKSISVMVD